MPENKKKYHHTELRLPRPLHSKAKKMAQLKGLSFNQYVRFSVQEKLESDLKAQSAQD